MTITDAVPAHTTFVSADSGGYLESSQTVPGGSAPGKNQVRWANKTLPAGEHLTMTMVVRADNPLPGGTVIVNDDYQTGRQFRI